jgi:uncharacterized 2Fe-2S/4Fe-4S cluster protein (DUF4445 family)
VLINKGEIILQTIDHAPPVGLCGSGILDLVAQMAKAGIVNKSGGINPPENHHRIRKGTHGLEFILVPASENKGKEITFSRRDINEIQLAKGAMRTSVQILLEKAGLSEADIDTVIIAGAFGTYLDVQSGIDIGMFPRIGREKFLQVGNAAGAGTRMTLLSTEKRTQAAQVAGNVTYVELTIEPSFSPWFARNLQLNT